MNYTIRRAKLSDARKLPAIEQSAGQSFRNVPGLAWIADDQVMPGEHHEALIEAGTSWVADANGDVIGFLSAEAIGDELHVWEASVHHDWQGRGVGRALFETAIAAASKAGCSAVTLTTFRDLAWNERFYVALGFVTLESGAVDRRLSTVLAAEIQHGLPGEQRCAMRLSLTTDQLAANAA